MDETKGTGETESSDAQPTSASTLAALDLVSDAQLVVLAMMAANEYVQGLSDGEDKECVRRLASRIISLASEGARSRTKSREESAA